MPTRENSCHTEIRNLLRSDIPSLVDCFEQENWGKPTSLFEQYLNEKDQNLRDVWIAVSNDDMIAGYITLSWQSKYLAFHLDNIPEIMDLNVLPQFRNKGIGSKLLHVAETKAFSKSDTVGIGVGLYAGKDGGYGAAQKLYVKAGYIPDGKGMTYNYEAVIPGNSYQVDDDLVLWFTKDFK